MHFFEKSKLFKNKTKSKMQIPHVLLERWNLYFSSCKNAELKIKLIVLATGKKCIFSNFYFVLRKFYWMYRVLNKHSKDIYFYISKKLNSCTFLLVFKILKTPQCIYFQSRIYISFCKHVTTRMKQFFLLAFSLMLYQLAWIHIAWTGSLVSWTYRVRMKWKIDEKNGVNFLENVIIM